ncbi:MAG: CsgG/HfaB family protein [Bacteroidales bacterium]
MSKKTSLAVYLMMLGTPVLFSQKNPILIQTQEVASPIENEAKVLKRKVAIARFSNETLYAKGLFYDKENDPMGKQALDILSAKLAATNKFLLLERNDLNLLLAEAAKKDTAIQSIDADYLIIGSITEYGRKNIGQSKVFSSSKSQIVEAAVSIRLVDVSTGLIIYSDEAKGEAEQTTKTTLGLGGKADFDATLSDKAISGAISQLVENIINKCTDKPWKSYLLSVDEDNVIMAGGASQGIEAGDKFLVMRKGKTVKNPQTGAMIELPGKEIGRVKVLMCGGDTAETEYSILEIMQGKENIHNNELQNYYIQQSL